MSCPRVGETSSSPRRRFVPYDSTGSFPQFSAAVRTSRIDCLPSAPICDPFFFRLLHRQSRSRVIYERCTRRESLRITYVGRCPFATDDSIDARLTPEELLAIFGDHQIAIEQQPDYFDSVIPPDRRRYRSQPGGLPTTDDALVERKVMVPSRHGLWSSCSARNCQSSWRSISSPGNRR